MSVALPLNVLVIDDNQDQLSWFLSLNSSQQEFRFHALKNEANVTAALDRVQPSVIFLDIALNFLDGPLVASIIHGHGYEDTPIIPMSSDAKNRRLLESEHFLVKPLNKETVLRKIKEVLGLK